MMDQDTIEHIIWSYLVKHLSEDSGTSLPLVQGLWFLRTEKEACLVVVVVVIAVVFRL